MMHVVIFVRNSFVFRATRGFNCYHVRFGVDRRAGEIANNWQSLRPLLVFCLIVTDDIGRSSTSMGSPSAVAVSLLSGCPPSDIFPMFTCSGVRVGRTRVAVEPLGTRSDAHSSRLPASPISYVSCIYIISHCFKLKIRI